MTALPTVTQAQDYLAALGAAGTVDEDTPARGLIRDCLQTMLPHWSDALRDISPDSPFLKEFSATVKAGDVTPEACFALLECCILFIREKALRHGTQTLSDAERSLLHHFEHSGAWPFSAGLLVSWWYWYELPRRCKEQETDRS